MDAASPILTSALQGRYEFERSLGVGGMARVYLASDLRHGRKVAVKVVRDDVAAALGAERFLNEIRTTASLQYSVDRGFVNHPMLAHHDRFIDPLRSLPEFTSLLERVRVTWTQHQDESPVEHGG